MAEDQTKGDRMSRARREQRDLVTGRRIVQRVTLTHTIALGSPGEKPTLRVNLEKISAADAVVILRRAIEGIEAEHIKVAEKIVAPV